MNVGLIKKRKENRWLAGYKSLFVKHYLSIIQTPPSLLQDVKTLDKKILAASRFFYPGIYISETLGHRFVLYTQTPLGLAQRSNVVAWISPGITVLTEIRTRL